MNISAMSQKIDAAIRFLLYVLILLLPFSSAAVETCVILSLILWIAKHSLILYNSRQTKGWRFKLIPQSFRPSSTPLDVPIIFFVLACLISIVLCQTPLSSFRAFLTKTSEWFVVLFLVRETVVSKKHIITILKVLTFSAAVTAIDAFIQFYGTGQDIFLGRELTRGGATAGFNHANGLGGYLTVIIPLLLSFCFLPFQRRTKPFCVLLLGVFFWTLVLTLSRGAWISVLAGVFIFLFMRARRLIKYLAIAILGCVLLFYFLAPTSLRHRVRLDREGITSVVSWRWGLWEDSLKMIRERPLTGHGINTFMRLFQNYRRMAWDHDPTKYTPQPYGPTYAHNCFVQMTAEVGILGMLCFAWLLLIFYRHSWNMIIKKESWDQNLKIIFIGLFSGLSAFLIHCLFDTHLYSLKLSVYFWFMMAVTLNILRLLNPDNYDINGNYE